MFFRKALVVPLCMAASFVVPAPDRQSPKSKSILGAWQVSAVAGSGEVPSNDAPQPGLYLFTAKHYSIVQVNAQEPRKPMADSTSAEAWAAVYGNAAFSASAGAYEVSGDKLTMHTFVSKNPGPMGPDKFVVRTYQLSPDGSTLTLTGVANQNGPTPKEPAYTLHRVE